MGSIFPPFHKNLCCLHACASWAKLSLLSLAFKFLGNLPQPSFSAFHLITSTHLPPHTSAHTLNTSPLPLSWHSHCLQFPPLLVNTYSSFKAQVKFPLGGEALASPCHWHSSLLLSLMRTNIVVVGPQCDICPPHRQQALQERSRFQSSLNSHSSG